jgi:hypothetical protein
MARKDRVTVKTIDSIQKTLARFPTEYARGRALQAALAPHASPAEVLAVLDLAASTTHPERDAITFALVTEHQRASHPLWQSVLLVAYEPMLANVWKRLHDKRDAESRIVLAFIEAIAKVSLAHPPSHLALHLRHAVERGAFGSTAAAHLEPELVSLTAARKERSHDSPEACALLDDEKSRLRSELDSVFGDDAPIVLDVLVHARRGREALEAFVAETHPHLTGKQRAVMFDRLQSLRRRALVHLGDRFGSAIEIAASSAA